MFKRPEPFEDTFNLLITDGLIWNLTETLSENAEDEW